MKRIVLLIMLAVIVITSIAETLVFSASIRAEYMSDFERKFRSPDYYSGIRDIVYCYSADGISVQTGASVPANAKWITLLSFRVKYDTESYASISDAVFSYSVDGITIQTGTSVPANAKWATLSSFYVKYGPESYARITDQVFKYSVDGATTQSGTSVPANAKWATLSSFKSKYASPDYTSSIKSQEYGYYTINSAPSISVNTSTGGWYNADFPISLTFDDIDNNNLTISISDGPTNLYSNTFSGTVTPNTITPLINIGLLASGTRILTISAFDGIDRTTKTISVNLDRMDPTIILTPSSNNWTSGNIGVTATVNGTGSSVVTKKWIFGSQPESFFKGGGGTTLGDSFDATTNGTYTVYASDQAGNDTIATVAINGIDKLPPVITASDTNYSYRETPFQVALTYNGTGSPLAHSKFNLTNTTATPEVWNTYSNPVPITDSGIWYLHYAAVDIAGNTTTAYFGPYKLDMIAPAITLTPSTSAFTNSDVVVNAAIDGTGSTVVAKKYATSSQEATFFKTGGGTDFVNSFVATSNGIYTVYARDESGRETVRIIDLINIDKVAPMVTASETDYFWKPSPFIIGMDYNGTGSPTAKKEYKLTDSVDVPSSWDTYIEPIGISENGVWYIHYKASDSAGNSKVGLFGPYRLDTEFQDYSLQIKGSAGSNAIRLSWGIVENASSYEIEVNGKSLGITVPSTQQSYTISDLLSNSTYQLRVRGVKEGMPGPWSNLLEVNTTKPLPNRITTITYTTTNKLIELTWQKANNAWNYEVEFDGELQPLTPKLSLRIDKLPQNSAHTVRVRGVNSDGAGPWSDINYIWTANRPPGELAGLTCRADNKTLRLGWNALDDADSYDVTLSSYFDGEKTGETTDSVTDAFIDYSGLNPKGTYSATVRAVNRAGKGPGATVENLRLYDLPTPAIKWLDADYADVIVQWDKLEGANFYELEADGTIVGSTSLDRYTFKFDSSSKHIYRLRALSGTGTSNWSEPFESQRIPMRPDWVSNLLFTLSQDTIKLKWDAPEPRTESDEDAIKGYDVEIDGYIVQIEDPGYISEGLLPGSSHSFRVRAVTGYRDGFWTNYYTVKTPMGVLPPIYKIRMVNNRHTSTMTWDSVEGSEWYEVETSDFDADGDKTNVKVIKGYSDEWFEQHGVSEFTEHGYRVRACNSYGKGPWSRQIINNSIQAKVERDKELDLGLTATDVTDFKKYRLEVYYPSVLKVEDLCAYTGKKELSTGFIEGTPIEIVDHSPGRIEFVIHKLIDEGTSWTGIINNILFKGRQTGGTTITYTVHDIEGEYEPVREHDLKLLEEENFKKANPYAPEF